DRFLKLGVIFVDDVAEVPIGMPIMLSAHGSAPQVVELARQRGSYVVDSVCPLVTKVHHEVRVRAGKGFRIVYVGHEGHEEAVGTMAVAPEAISRVESLEEVEALPNFSEPVALLAQTCSYKRREPCYCRSTTKAASRCWRSGAVCLTRGE
ncbi:MAG: 4-hydroxy-3-methylbut-2-enyl diphosphate reductase, partial [Actinomycetes bacterium]